MNAIKRASLILALILSLTLCFAFVAGAEGELTDGVFTYIVTDDKATIVKIDAAAEDNLFIPTDICGFPVDSISLDAFSECSGVLTVHFCGTQLDWDLIVAGNDVLSGRTLHLAEIIAEAPATCEESGLTEGVYCSACDTWFTERNEIPAKGHSFTDYQSDGNATIFADGTKTAYCDNGCGKSDTVADEGSKLVLGTTSKISSSSTASSIKLSWKAVPYATGYRVYQKTSGGSWKRLTSTENTTYTIKKLKTGTVYTFAVQAYNKTNGVVLFSPDRVSFRTACTLPETKVSSSARQTSIKLMWNEVSNATGYRIYQKTSDGWKTVEKEVTKTAYRVSGLTAGKKYTFAVRPYIKTDDTTVYGEYDAYKGATKTEAVTTKLYKNEGGSITIGCKDISGADAYRLYYKKDGAKSYKLYKKYPKNQKITIDNLQGGSKYVFAIRAGIKKSDGVEWSDYKALSVTVNYRIDRYNDIIKSGNFYFETHDGNGAYSGMAMKNGSYCLDMKDQNSRIRVVYKAQNKRWYVVDDINKFYIVQKDDGSFEQTMNEAMSTPSTSIKYKATTEKVGSKTYFVESYTENGETIKYYFNGNKIVKEVYIYDGETVTAYYTKFTKTVPSSLFSIPSTYTKVTA